MDKRSGRRLAGSVHDKLRWTDVVDGRLSRLTLPPGGAEGQGMEVTIGGKLSDLFDAPSTPVFSGMDAAEATEALAKILCDAVLAANRAGIAVSVEIDGKVHRIDSETSERDLGRIEGKLARALQASRQAIAAAASRVGSTVSAHVGAPAWLRAPSGTAPDGRQIYQQGEVFNANIARAIWAAFDRYIEGDSLELVSSYLNEKDYQPPGVSPLPLGEGRTVHPWKAQMVDFQISSLAAIGLRNGAQVDLESAQPPAPQRPALLSWPTFRLVQDLRSTPLEGGRSDATHLLSGRVFCRRCQLEGHDLQPMNPASRSGGRTLVCQRKGAEHPGPLYEDFEAQLLQWLQTQEHIAPELDHILAATDEELRQSMETFCWPPSHSESPQSLEVAVRALRGRAQDDKAIDMRAKVDSFLAKLESEPKSSERAALRRKMRNVLRRHVARVFVSAAEAQTRKGTPKHNPIEEITVDERDAITLFSSRDSIFTRQGGLRSDARLFSVVVQRVGHAHPDPEFVLALSVKRFELPPETDWEQILLSPTDDDHYDLPPQEQPDAASHPEAANSPSVGGTAVDETASNTISTPGSREVVSTGSQAAPTTPIEDSACLEEEWTGYQPNSNSSFSRPWGVHVCAKDLDDLADQFLEQLWGQHPSRDARRQADHLALGMLLSALELFARFDSWLVEILRSSCDGQAPRDIHWLVFQAICPAAGSHVDVSSIGREDDASVFPLRNNINRQRGNQEFLSAVFNQFFKGRPQSLQLATSLAAALEGLRWAQESVGRPNQNPNLAVMAELVLTKGLPKEYFAAHPLSLHFEQPSAWQWLAARIRRRIKRGLQTKSDARHGTWRAAELRRALQAQHFPPPGSGSRPAPIYVHGDGRVARRLRNALGI
jgi:hypothetical protein